MTPQAVLADLLERLKANRGETVHIGRSELNEWPAESVAALTAARLLVKARRASSFTCPGCEKNCFKDVDVFPDEGGRPARAYIYCDEPENMGRVDIELASLEQWRLSADAKPAALAHALGNQEADIGSVAWRKDKAKAAADARHDKPGGSREKQEKIRAIWASGKYTSRDRCAEEECGALGMSFKAARRALENTPDPK